MSGFALVQNHDGANHAAQAVLACLRNIIGDGIQSSWDGQLGHYRADIRVTRYDNCREQGYVVYLRDAKHDKQINIAFYEHRNSDNICAVRSEKCTFNAPTLEDITLAMKDKWDVSCDVRFNEAYRLAEWIAEQLTEFWDAHAKA